MLVGCGKSLSYRIRSAARWSTEDLTLARSNQKQPNICRLKYSLGSRSYSGCSRWTPQFFHCQSSESRAKGIQPTPLSTETKFNAGNRWQIPPQMRLAMVRALPMKNETPIEA